MRKLILLILITSFVATILWWFNNTDILPPHIKSVYQQYYVAIRAIAILILGILFINLIVNFTGAKLKHLGKEVYMFRNLIQIIGYFALSLVIFGTLGIGESGLIAGATFSGLVIGLGIQPILGNLFSGLLILATGFLKPGTTVKLGSGTLPITYLSFPAYKNFSLDTAYVVIKGVVYEVGLMYTKILLESGELMKIPNSSIFSNAVVIEEMGEEKNVQVRYEFPLQCPPELVLNHVAESLSELEKIYNTRFNLYIEEQSDKNFYILLVKATTPHTKKIREFRSEIMVRLINVHRKLVKENICSG